VEVALVAPIQAATLHRAKYSRQRGSKRGLASNGQLATPPVTTKALDCSTKRSHSVPMSSQSLLDVWEAASSSPYQPTIGKNSQFTVGFILLLIGRLS
jgi:hypothetical protein